LGWVEHSAPFEQLVLGTHAGALLLALGLVQRGWHVATPGGACGATEPVGHCVHTRAAPPLPPFFFVEAPTPVLCTA
jgi:hypothetical protein